MKISFAVIPFLAVSLQAAHVVYQVNLPGSLVATDSSGNTYALNSSGLSKLDAAGNLKYSTPFAFGSISLAGSGIAVDSTGGVVFAGQTNSDTFPTTPGVFQPKRSPGTCISGDRAAQPFPCPDAFVVKVDPTGKVAWASYLGGLSIDQINGVAVDPSGNVYVTGFTRSNDFPTVGAFQPQFGGYADGFVTKISSDGTKLLYSSFLGGTGFDLAHAIAVDSAGNAYVAGELNGPAASFVTPAGFGTACGATTINGFLAKVSPTGDRLLFAGCLGPDMSYSAATVVTVDSQGSIYLGGYTNSPNFPFTAGAFHNVGKTPYLDFVAKIPADGSAFSYSALFNGEDFGVLNIGVDSSGNAYASGPASALQPVVGPAIQPCPGPDFLLKLNATGSAVYSSFDDASRSSVTPDGSVILSGATAITKLSALETPADSYLAGACVLNAASLASHLDYGQPGISPGEIVALKGTGLGPIVPPDPVIANGILSNILGGTQVFFDGVAAPLMYVQDGQINAIAPYSLAGKTSTSIQVQYQGRKTTPVTLPVSSVSAALFQNADGSPMVLNGDYSRNSPTNPVARGGFLILYLTGSGQTSPASVDGQVWQTIGGLQASPISAQLTSYAYAGMVQSTVPVAYAGPVPSLVSGVQQFNIVIPANLPDSFVTPAIGVSSGIVVQIGTAQVSFNVAVK